MIKRYGVRVTFDVEIVSDSPDAAEDEAFNYMAEVAMKYDRDQFEVEALSATELLAWEREMFEDMSATEHEG